MSDDFYKILEVEADANPEDIKRSYRKLSLKHHPDRNGGSIESVKMFQKISAAFETLGDADKRRQYDISRKIKSGGMGGMGGMGMFGNMFSGFPAGTTFETHSMPGVNTPEDFFAKFFEGMGGIGGMGGMGVNGMGNAHVKMFRNGVPINITHAQNQSQNEFEMHFGGPNGIESKPTPITKKVTIDMMMSIVGDKLPIEYERWILEEGVKKTETVKIYLDIPMGIDTNEIIVIRDAGNIIHDRCKGDLKIIITVENDSIFKRQGMDLVMQKCLTLKESLCGFTFDIKHLNGRTYTLTTPAGNVITPGYVKVIPDLGVLREGKVGKLIVQFTIEYPSKLDASVVEKLSDIL